MTFAELFADGDGLFLMTLADLIYPFMPLESATNLIGSC
jgi:hypothetical protein